MESLANQFEIRSYVADADDRYSKHSDAYFYFKWSELETIVKILEEAGAAGDILDVPESFPVEFEEIVRNLGWRLNRKLSR